MSIKTKNYEPLVLVETAHLSEDEWLEYRKKGIGGSDAAAILGVSPFATARDLYYDKLNLFKGDRYESNWVAKKVGHLLEDLVAEIFHVKTGYRIYQVKKMFYHPQNPFMLADIDYFINLPNGKTAILEIKTTHYQAKEHWWRDGEETVPVNYEVQGRHYMCVMNMDEVFYCCLYGNSEDDVIIRHIVRDTAYESELIALEEYFWNDYVLKKIPPPYTEDGDLILNSVRNYFGTANPNEPPVELSIPMASNISRLLELQAQKRLIDTQSKKLESEMKRIQGRVVAEMGQSCTAVCSVGDEAYTVTYKPMRKTGINKDNLIRLKAQHPDIYEEYVTVSESRRFYVKRSHEDAA